MSYINEKENDGLFFYGILETTFKILHKLVKLVDRLNSFQEQYTVTFYKQIYDFSIYYLIENDLSKS